VKPFLFQHQTDGVTQAIIIVDNQYILHSLSRIVAKTMRE
jgi:hypothetical protein